MNQRNSGFTLLEMMMSVGILTIVSLLTFVALRSSTQSSILNAAKEEVAGNLRETLLSINAEVRQAYTTRTVAAAPPIAPEKAFSITVINQGRGLRFCVPDPASDSPRPNASTPIEIIFENEDTAGGQANGRLDSGEDVNGDGVLTRRLVRRQDGQTRVLGAANNISDVTFELVKNSAATSQNLNTLRIRLQGSKAIAIGGAYDMVRAESSSQIHIEN